MSAFRTEIKYALLISLLTLLWLAMEYMLGLQDTYIQFHWYCSLLAIAIPILCIQRAIEEKRQTQDGHITFKQALLTGFMTTFFAAVLSAPIQVIFHQLINPYFFETMMTYTLSRAQHLHLNINEARQEAELYFNLTSYIIQSGFGTLFLGTIIALFWSGRMKTE